MVSFIIPIVFGVELVDFDVGDVIATVVEPDGYLKLEATSC